MIISSVCRNVDINQIAVFKKIKIPIPGDVLLAKVASIGYYNSIEVANGKLRKIKVGDEILVAQGNRYSTQVHEVLVSNKDLILGSLGGVVGKSNEFLKHTKLKIIGYAQDKTGEIINLKKFAFLDIVSHNTNKTKVLLILGSDMDSGKTTCAAYLAKKYSSRGNIVNYGKITGTARLKDLLTVEKSGAKKIMDFTDCGFASTYKVNTEELEKIIKKIYTKLSMGNPDYLIFEISDGILQRETNVIIKSKFLNKFRPEVFFCCKDSLAVGEAKRFLKKNGLKISFVSGLVANSILGIREVENNFFIKCVNTKY